MQILNGKGAIQYDSDAIATASLRKAITIYNIQGCAVIQYLQYLIPQPPVELKVDRMSITIFKLIQYCCLPELSLSRHNFAARLDLKIF